MQFTCYRQGSLRKLGPGAVEISGWNFGLVETEPNIFRDELSPFIYVGSDPSIKAVLTVRV